MRITLADLLSNGRSKAMRKLRDQSNWRERRGLILHPAVWKATIHIAKQDGIMLSPFVAKRLVSDPRVAKLAVQIANGETGENHD